MSRTNVRWRWVVVAAVLALPASTVVLPSQAAHADTPGQRANRLEDDLRALQKAESDMRSQANAARSALVVGTAKWEAAKDKLAAARKDAAEKKKQADAAEVKAEEKRAGVASFASSVYQNPVDSSMALASGIGSAEPMTKARNVADLDQVAEQQSSKLEGYEAAKIAWDVFARQAKRAERAAAALESQLATQRVKLRADAKKSTEKLSKAIEKVNALQSKVDRLEAQERKRLAKLEAEKRAKRLKQLAKLGFGGGGGGGSCSKSANISYPNGLIPQSALCPLPQSGWYLRADAARGFYKMNAAYRATFGSDMCVNSAYRPLQRQYELYSSMPSGYAAVPGTSNHGWGTAVDLGCGVNQFGTAQHNWVRNKGPQWGFVHPAWARGSVQEPWHFEYQG